MRRLPFPIAVVLCALALGGRAPAASYDDFQDGCWQLPQTWTSTAGSYPQSPGDQAVIDSNEVQAVWDCPAGVATYIGGGGTLKLTGYDQKFHSPITMNGGTLLFTNLAEVTAPLTVNGPSTVSSTNGWGPMLSNGIAGAGLIAKTGHSGLAVGGDNPGFSGGWDVQAGRLEVVGGGAAGTGAINVRGGAELRLQADQDGAAAPSSVTLADGAALHAEYGVNVCGGWHVVMDAGSSIRNKTATFGGDGSIAVLGAVAFDGVHSYPPPTFDVPVSGGTGAAVSFVGSYCTLGGDNSNFKGDWLVTAGTLRLTHPLALGLNAGSGVVDVASGTTLAVQEPLALARDVTLHEATFECTGGTAHSGGISLAGDATFVVPGDNNQAKGIDVTGQVAEPTPGRKVRVAGAGEVRFANAGNDWTGGTEVSDGGELKVTADGQLGTGAVSVNKGFFRTDGGKAACLTDVGAVEVTRGMLRLNSTELPGTVIRLNEYGALHVAGGATPQNWQGNIVLSPGAVLCPDNVPTLPTTAEIGGQVLKGLTGDVGAGDVHDVGPSTEPGDLWRGLASAEEAASFIAIRGTINENQPAGGFEVFAHVRTSFLVVGTPTLNATGAVRLTGDGWFGFDSGWGGSASTIDVSMANGAEVAFRAAGALPAGKTVEINSGRVNCAYAGDAFAPGSQVNVNPGGILWANNALTSGQVRVRAAGAVICSTPAGLGPEGAGMFTWERGAQLGLSGSLDTDEFPTDGTVDFINCYGAYTQPRGIVLGDDTRLTNCSSGSMGSTAVSSVGGSARIAARGGTDFYMNGPIDLPGKTLIVGDTVEFVACVHGGRTEPLTQDGVVHLRHATGNRIGRIDIRAGTLRAEHAASLGAAEEISIAPAARFWYYPHGSALAGRVTGNGEVFVGYSGTSELTMAPAGVLAPGDGAGEMTLTGGLAFGASGDDRGRVEIDVLAHGGVGGADHDLLVVSSTARLTGGALAVGLPLPSGELDPAALAAIDMTIIETGGISGTFAEVVRADGTDAHWHIDPDGAVERLGGDLVLHGAAISWLGFPGDVTCDDLVDYVDLGILATHYDRTGAGWGQGDFTFDGRVDYVDLGLLASNYDKTAPPAGGAPIPEPAGFVVLALGVVGLLRRR